MGILSEGLNKILGKTHSVASEEGTKALNNDSDFNTKEKELATTKAQPISIEVRAFVNLLKRIKQEKIIDNDTLELFDNQLKKIKDNLDIDENILRRLDAIRTNYYEIKFKSKKITSQGEAYTQNDLDHAITYFKDKIGQSY